MSQVLRTYEELGYRKLSDVVFIKLRHEILNATLKPGDKLRQTELSEKYGVSRAPVRDAIRKLEAEGLVTMNRSSAVVSSVALGEFLEIYRIREVLETFAARMATPTISDEALIALTDLVERMEQASRKGNLSVWLESDVKFHNDSYKSCNCPILLKMIAGLWNSTHYTRRQYVVLPGKIECAEKTHRAMLEALAARDGERYARLVSEHISESIRTVMEQPADTFAPCV